MSEEKLENSHNHHNHHDYHAHNDHNEEIQELTGTKFFWVVFLNLAITAAEFIGGLISGSLSLLSDSLHNLTDATSLILSYIAHLFSKKEPNLKNTFGYKRIRIIAAFLNSSTLLVICGIIIKEAIERFINPQAIDANIVLIVGTVGLVANILSMLFLKSHAHNNLNVKSAYLHMLSDTLSSIVVILGALFTKVFKITWLDPLLTLLIATYIGKETIEIFLKSLNVLMQSTPTDVDLERISKKIMEIPEISDVHHIHIWNLDENTIFLEAHVNLNSDVKVSDTMAIKELIEEKLKESEINHITIQFEFDGCPGCGIIPKSHS
ncbi:MAG: cation diffusion facilitator family transporter [Fervidobacterium sp.]